MTAVQAILILKRPAYLSGDLEFKLDRIRL